MIDIDRTGEICFVEMYGKTLIVAVEQLKASEPYIRLRRETLPINRALIEGNVLRHDVDYVTKAFISKNPITIFIPKTDADNWFIGDGRHRLWGAYKLGLKAIPCKLVPYNLWTCFIVHKRIFLEKEFGRPQQSKTEPLLIHNKSSNAGYGF